MPPAVKLFLAANIAVFLAWRLAAVYPGVERFMALDFLTSPRHLAAGRYWTLLTSVFSHAELWHLVFNMVVLVSFGRILELLMGTRRFVAFYLTAGIVASLGHCAVSAWLLHRPDTMALGASGALSAVLVVFALAFPRERILIFGIVPIPAWVGALAFAGLDLWGLSAQAHGGGLPIGHGAHLAGAAFGLVAWFAGLRDTFRRPEPPSSAPHRWAGGFPPPPYRTVPGRENGNGSGLR